MNECSYFYKLELVKFLKVIPKGLLKVKENRDMSSVIAVSVISISDSVVFLVSYDEAWQLLTKRMTFPSSSLFMLA